MKMPVNIQLLRWTVAVVLLLLTGSLLVFQPCAFAQSETASVSGQVTDQSGAVIPDAQVEIKNVDTNVSLVTRTNGVGFYVFPVLKPGNYLINVSKPMFRTVSVTGIQLSVQQDLSRNFVLQVGSSAESVTVTANAESVVNTVDGSVGTVIDRSFVENMPLNGRSYQTLIALSPGVIMTPVSVNGSDQGQFSANGMRTNANYFTVDGVSANFGVPVFQGLAQATSGSLPSTNIQGGFSNLVSVDAMQEFKIQTSTFAPEYGRTPGAQISIVSRSGTNDFHGSLFEYFRNDITDAKDFFDISKPPLRFNDFGGTIGGPVIIPKLYNGRDKTFFFFSYEGQRFVLPQPTAITTVPTQAERDAAPNPIARDMLNAFALPNGPAVATGGARFTATYSDPNSMDSYSIRIDHNFNEKYSIFGRFNNAPSFAKNRDNHNLSQGNTFIQNTRTFTLGSTQVLTNRLVNEVRLNYSRQQGNWLDFYTNFGGGQVPNTSYFVPPGFNTSQPGYYLYYLYAYTAPDGYPLGATNGGVALNETRSIDGVDNMSFTVGSHQLKFGFDYRWYEGVTPGNDGIFGYYFTGALSQVYSLTPTFFLFSHSVRTALLNPNYSAYFQDTWRVNPRLTLTYGTRWDINPAPSAAGSGRHLPTIANLPPLNQYDWSSLQLAPLGTPYYPTSYTNFGPRVGIAYQAIRKPGKELVLRGGWGLFYDLASTPFGGGSWPYSYSNFIFGPPAIPVPDSLVQIPPVNFTPSPTHRASSVGVTEPGYNMPKIYQWNLTLEQNLGRNQTLSVGYIGSVGSGLVRTVQLSLNSSNAVPNLYWNPNFSSVTLVSNGSNSDYNSMQVQFNRHMAKGLQALLSYTWSHSTDDSSTTSSSPGFGFIYPASVNWGNSDFDVRHSFSGALTYDIPSPNWGAVSNAFLKNWSIDSTFYARSGLPFTVGYTELAPNNSVGTFRRPDVVPGVPEIISDSSAPGGWRVNPAAFVLPASQFGQGDEGRNSLYGFGAWQIDLGVHRVFNLKEKTKLEFRMEAFNIFNHPNFANPNATLSNYPSYNVPVGFGVATQTLARGFNGGSNTGGFNPLFQSGGPRDIQFALRLSF